MHVIVNNNTCTLEISRKGTQWLGKRTFDPKLSLKMVPTVDLIERRASAVTVTSDNSQTQKSTSNTTTNINMLSTVHNSKYSISQIEKLMLGPYIYTKTDPLADFKKQAAVKTGQSDEHCGPLYTLLLSLRNNIAHDMDIPPHLVANNKDLIELARVRPSSRGKILNVDGMSSIKVKRMGDQVLAVIQSYCDEHDASYDNFPHNPVVEATQSNLSERKNNDTGILTTSISYTQKQTYNLFHDKGFTLDEIGKERGLQLSTLGTHLAEALLAGYPVCFQRLGITSGMVSNVETIVRNPPISNDLSSLSAIKDRVGSSVDWSQLKIVLAYLKVTYGETNTPAVSLNQYANENAPIKPTFTTQRKSNFFKPAPSAPPKIASPKVNVFGGEAINKRQPGLLLPSGMSTADRRRNISQQSRHFLTDVNKVNWPLNSPSVSSFTPAKSQKSPANETQKGKRKIPSWGNQKYKFKKSKK